VTASHSQAMMADGESSEVLQRRLAAFARLMFFAFVALRVAEFVLYRVYLDIWPDHYWTIFVIGASNVVLLAGAWFTIARVSMSRERLHAVDIGVMALCGGVFGAIAMLAANRPESAYTCLIYACFMVFTRTIVVPSTGSRTTIVCAIAMVPLVAAALFLAITTKEDVPGPAFFGGGLMYASVGVVVAATGSRVIYGLRRRVSSLAREELELGQYRLVRKLGEGAIGEVFVARHVLLRRPTAVKLLQPDRIGLHTLARCERAVQEMSHLRHHNTIAVYDYGRSPDGVFYFAMEYIEGVDLGTLLERYGVQSPARVIAIAIQLCAALHEAHERRFVHGNIKPSNVILSERGGLCDVAKLTDFGFASETATPADDLSAVGLLVATLVGDNAAAAAVAACFASSTTAKQLMHALRGLGHEWTSVQARTWWDDYRRARTLAPASVTLVELDRSSPV
jgi:eukaryotic-like serine/threonine-protein kinase